MVVVRPRDDPYAGVGGEFAAVSFLVAEGGHRCTGPSPRPLAVGWSRDLPVVVLGEFGDPVAVGGHPRRPAQLVLGPGGGDP